MSLDNFVFQARKITRNFRKGCTENSLVNTVPVNRIPFMNIVPYGLLQPASAPLESSIVQKDTDGKFTGTVHGKVPVQCILMPIRADGVGHCVTAYRLV